MYIPSPQLVERAHATLDGKSRGYVDDARAFARAIITIGTGVVRPPYENLQDWLSEPAEAIWRLQAENVQLQDQLRIVQARCTELLEENRTLRR